MMEKVVTGLGAVTGVIAGFVFFAFWRDLPLPGLLFVLVDTLGPTITAVIFGILTAVVATFAFVLLIDALWPKNKS